MKRATLLLLVMGLFCFIQLQAQQWTVYNTINSDIPANQISTLVIDASGNKWIGTSSGISKFDNTNWSTYSSYSHVYWGQGIALDTNDSLWLAPNSGEITMCQLNDSCYSYVDSTGYFPSSYSQFVIAIDSSNNVWTAGGAALKFDGTNWSAWTNLPAGYCIAIDANQNPWFGGGVTLNNFDGINWIQHSIIGSSFIQYITIDNNDVKWLGSLSGLIRYDGTTTIYTTSNSDIPSNQVRCVEVDGLGNKWVGTNYGLAKFDGTNWIVYTTSNSDLPSNNILSLAIDVNNKIWIGTVDEGLVVFDPSAIGIEEVVNRGNNLIVSPNPFSSSTTVKINSSNRSIQYCEMRLCDAYGRTVEQMNVTLPEFTLDRKGLPSGVYFLKLMQENKNIGIKKLVVTDR